MACLCSGSEEQVGQRCVECHKGPPTSVVAMPKGKEFIQRRSICLSEWVTSMLYLYLLLVQFALDGTKVTLQLGLVKSGYRSEE